LRDNGLHVTDVAEITRFPECFDGRVKTLHPMIHGGLLYLRGSPEHVEQARMLGVEPIDLVVVNLYPFEETVKKPGVTLKEAIENIDIGGPSMLRSGAKNSESVTVACDPSHYILIQNEMKRLKGFTGEMLRFRLGTEAYATTSRYDAAIAEYRRKLVGPL